MQGQTLKQHIDITLGQGNIKEAVLLPPGEDLNEWLAVNTVDYYNAISVLYGTLLEFCTARSCPMMSAGPKVRLENPCGFLPAVLYCSRAVHLCFLPLLLPPLSCLQHALLAYDGSWVDCACSLQYSTAHFVQRLVPFVGFTAPSRSDSGVSDCTGGAHLDLSCCTAHNHIPPCLGSPVLHVSQVPYKGLEAIVPHAPHPQRWPGPLCLLKLFH
jgi:hypothetical protein